MHSTLGRTGASQNNKRPATLRVLCTGGRNFSDRSLAIATLTAIEKIYGKIDQLIHGNAAGADLICNEWAIEGGVSVRAVNAEWKLYGKAAGIIRNKKMLLYKPNLVVAFPGGKGTAHMTKIAQEAGIVTLIITRDSFNHEPLTLYKSLLES